MAKQTFTTGQVLTAAQVNSLQTNDFNQTVSVKTAAYVLAAADKGTRIEFNTSGSVTCTVNTGLFDAGDTVIIQNRGAGDVTVTAGTATVNTAGSLVLSQYQSGTLYFISASASIFFAAAVGDLTAVTSGTGISISNAGGPVPTITNSMATEISAKGDLIVGTGSGTFDNLTVGANGTTLVADSSVSPTGLKWAVDPVADIVTTAGDILYATAADTLTRLGIGTAGQVLKVNSGATAPEWGAASSTPTAVGASAYKSSEQTLSNATRTVVTFNTEWFDTDGFHDNSTNTGRFTVPSGKGGKYLITGTVDFASNGTGRRLVRFVKNGTTAYAESEAPPSGNQDTSISITCTVALDLVATDYIEMDAYQASGGNLNIFAGNTGCHMSVIYLGA